MLATVYPDHMSICALACVCANLLAHIIICVFLARLQVKKQQWDKATRLCRFIKDPTMWATLAAMAMAAKELNTAETAFAAIDEVDKTHFVRKVRTTFILFLCITCIALVVHRNAWSA